MDPALIKKILDVIASQDEAAALALLPELVTGISAEEAAEGDPSAADAGSTAALDDAAAPAAPKPGEEAAKLRKELAAAAAADRAEVKKLRAELDTIKAERNAVESAERADLVAELVKLGVETPATAWQGDAKDRQPAKRFEAETVADLKARVDVIRASKPAGTITPPVSGEIEWTPAEVKALAKMTAEQQARFKEIRASRRS